MKSRAIFPKQFFLPIPRGTSDPVKRYEEQLRVKQGETLRQLKNGGSDGKSR